MKSKKRKLKVGIIGCGAIGSRMAQSIKRDLKNDCQLTSIFDIDTLKAKELQKNLRRKDKALAEMAARVILLKKTQLLYADEEDDE